MKNVLFFTLLLASAGVQSQQPTTQPVASGDYWQIDDYKTRLPELANDNSFPRIINFPNGSVGISSVAVNRLIGENEIRWAVGAQQNISGFVVEYSRDMRTFERAGQVQLIHTEGGTNYIFRHPFVDNNLVYYRVGIERNGSILAYTPAVQVLDEEYTTKVFPTMVKGSTFYIRTGQPYEKLQVLNTANQPVYEKGLGNQTGTITIGLPSLPGGIYFVWLMSDNRPQFVQRIMIDRN